MNPHLAFPLRLFKLAGLLLLSLVGCGVIIPVAPAPFLSVNTAGADARLDFYETHLAAIFARQDADRMRHAAGFPNDWSEPLPEWLSSRIDPTEAAAAAVSNQHIQPLAGQTGGNATYDGRWRDAQSFFYLSDNGPVTPGPFRIADQNALQSTIFFRSLSYHPARIAATCDGPSQLFQPDDMRNITAGTSFEFAIAGRERDATRLSLMPGGTSCQFEVSVGHHPSYQMALVPESSADPAMAALDARYDICVEPAPSRTDALEAAFFAGRWLSQSCAAPLGQTQLLPASQEGFNAKMEALTGATLPDAAFEAGDPNFALDFRSAPQLDLIMLSYLDLKADFSGAIISRALRHHAERGTLIRILVTSTLELEKDRSMYEGLAADFPNVQLQLFAWQPPLLAPLEEHIDALHRVHHIKMFATLSPEPGRSRAIIGGRNIHDGFLFPRALDLSAYPELHNYGEPGELSLDYFSTYHDFEVEISDLDMVRTLIAQVGTFWHRDFSTTVYRPFSIGVTGPGSATTPLQGARHFLSVPYLDGYALEGYWVDLIDSARVSVEIVTPYLNPTPVIEAALIRATDRGVAVTIVARIALYGDLGGRLMTEMNTLFVERYADRMTIYEYAPPDVVLHTKMLLIDGRLSIVSSVNLNQRSFLHDTENGLAVLDPAFYQRIRAVVQTYIDQAERPSPGDRSVRPISRELFDLAWVRTLF
jgi:cardiolipin synthase A/B